jgi:hypothetical protein
VNWATQQVPFPRFGLLAERGPDCWRVYWGSSEKGGHYDWWVYHEWIQGL